MTVEVNHAIAIATLRLVIGLKVSRQFFNQREAKPKPIGPWAGDFNFPRFEKVTDNFQEFHWFIALFAPVLIDQSNYFGTGFPTVVWIALCYYN